MADAIDDNFREVTNRIYNLEAENKALAKRVFELEMADWELALMVDPESTGYTIYETKQTRLFVSTKKIEPYLDGYKVDLLVGNPSFANFAGFTVRANWSRPQKTNETTIAWRSSGFRGSTNKQTGTLYAGKWNSVTVTLLPCSAEEIRRASIDFDLEEIQFGDTNLK